VAVPSFEHWKEEEKISTCHARSATAYLNSTTRISARSPVRRYGIFEKKEKRLQKKGMPVPFDKLGDKTPQKTSLFYFLEV
jgi:hypothetical protein